jgi:hypothetical protein
LQEILFIVRIMPVTITTRAFWLKQKSYLDMAQKGVPVVLTRTNLGRKQSFAIVPIDSEDAYFTPDVLQRLDASIEQFEQGKAMTLNSDAQLKTFLENL